MTQGEIVQEVCNKFGKNDAVSLTRATEFLQFQYRNVWNRFTWRDTITYRSTTNVANTATLTDDGTFELITGISFDGSPLRNVSLDVVMAQNPPLLTSTGTPGLYMNCPKSASGLCVIQFIPTPTTSVTVIISGKKTFVQLTGDSDSPIINGIDEVLVNLVSADFLERQRQFGKAAAKRAEANQALQAMADLELSQQQQIRQVTPFQTNWNPDEVSLGTIGILSKGNIY